MNAFRFLNDAFHRSPRRFALMLLDVSSVNPLAVYQTVIALLHPSVVAFSMIPIVALIGHFAINARMMTRLAIGARRIVSGCLSRGIAGTTVTTSDVLRSRYLDGAEIYHDMEKWSVQFNGLLARKLDDMIVIHYAPGSGVCTTYTHSQFYSSHVFVSTLPSATSPIQKFFFVHEISHALMYISTRPIASIAAVPAHLCMAAWLIYTLPWNEGLVGPVLALLITILVWHERAGWSARRLRVLSETVADAMAIVYLDDSDLTILAKSRLLASLRDDELSPFENILRRSALQEHIRLALIGNRDEVIQRSAEDLAITAPRFVEVLFLASVILLAAYAQAPTLTQLWVAGALLVAAFLLLVVTAIVWMAFQGSLSGALQEKFPASSLDPQESV
jgi:hypothetical protein